jgi:electron transfer flavoprotein beta subunit
MLVDQTQNQLWKALAIGANEAIRVNVLLMDFFCSKKLAEVIKNGGYDLIIAGKNH